MTKKLIIRSTDNEDWNGIWLKGEVEQEMREFNIHPYGNEWISYILDHVFEFQLSEQIENFILECSSLTSLTFRFDYGEVTIELI